MTARRTTDHITVGNGFRLCCQHCGESYTPTLPVSIEVLSATGKAFEKQHARCKAPKQPRCGACLELGHNLVDHVRLKVHSAAAWPGCGDDGLSSMAIWRHMRGVVQQPDADVPRDPADFGRCHRLLAASWAAGWRERMSEMTTGAWRAIAPAWEDLDALYLDELDEGTGASPRLYARLQMLRGDL